MKEKVIAAFDFDGTITYGDSFISFLKFTNSAARLFIGFSILTPVLALYKIGVIPNYRAKQIVFSWFYKGWSINDFDAKCKEFTIEIDKMVRPAALEIIKKYSNEGARIIIVSASLENWLKYWAFNNGINTVIGTKIEVDPKGYITGRFLSKNCYGQEKVNRLLELCPERESYILDAYGDSRGDKELILFADHGYMNKL